MSEETLRVLVVDDELRRCDGTGIFLREHYFYSVDTAADADRACELVRQSDIPYNVALIDDTLPPCAGEQPRQMGIELIDRIKCHSPQTEVVIFVDRSIETIEDVSKAGAFRYLSKPFSLTDVAIAVRQAAEYQQLKGAAREKQALKQLMESSAALLGNQSEQEVLDCILKGVHAIGFDRARLYLISDDGRSLVGKAQVGMHEKFVGAEWPISDDPHMQTLLEDRRPHVFKPQEGKRMHSEEMLDKEGIESWAAVPLLLKGQVIGQLAADNKVTGRPISEEELGPIALFASQAAAAIDNARLLEDAERRARNLNTVLRVSTTLSSSLELEQTLRTTCRSAVELLGVSHSGLVLFEPDLGKGKVYAEYPEMGILGLEIPLRGVAAEEGLIASRKPLVVPDVAHEPSFGPVRDILLNLKIRSILVVPIVSKDRILGSFSLDAVDYTSDFTEEEINLCKVLAAQVAVAIENAQLYEKTKGQAEQLDALRRTSLAVTSQLDWGTLLQTIIKQAVSLLKAKSGGIYEHHPERNELTVIADFNRPEHVGKTIKVGEGMAGRLVETGELSMTVDDYNEWRGRASVYADKRVYGAVLEVPLRWQQQTVGILYVDDDVGRQFTSDDAHLLGLFADQSVVALKNSELVARDEEKLNLLERLSEATKDIMGDLGTGTLDERLTLIAKHTAEILDAEVCGVLLVKRDGFLSLEASYGHREGFFQKGKEFEICSGPKSGLTGHIAYKGVVFNEYGERLINHFAVRGGEPDCTPSGICHSLLVVPLKEKTGRGEKLVGLLRAANKKGKDGDALPSRSFTREDAWILNIFAEAVVTAIEGAELVKQLSEQKDSLEEKDKHLGLLLRASDIVAQAKTVNEGLQGLAEMIVSLLTNTFCRILLRDETGDFLIPKAAYPIPRLKSGKTLNWKPGIGQAIGISEYPCLRERLESGEPRVLSYHDKEFQQGLAKLSRQLDLENNIQSLLIIPLKIEGKVVGLLDVGELRSEDRSKFTSEKKTLAAEIAAQATVQIDRMQLHETTEHERRKLRSLYEASNALVSSQDPHQVVQVIVGQTRLAAEASWVRVILIDEMYHPLDQIISGRDKQLDIANSIRPDGISVQVMRAGRAYAIEDMSTQRDRANPFMIEDGIAAALCLPMSLQGKRIGVMWINYNEPRRFPKFEVKALQLYVNQAAIAYDNARRIEELVHMRHAADALAQAADPQGVLDQIVQSARDVLRADSAAIWSYDSARNSFVQERPRAAGIPTELWQEFQKEAPRSGGTAYTVMERGYVGVGNVDDADQYPFLGESTRNLLGRIGAKSFQGIALMVGEERLGVLYVNYNRPRSFNDEECETARTFANHAALALKKAKLLDQKVKLLDQVSKARNAARVVAEVTTLENLQSTLESIVQKTQDALSCDVVTLYTYDSDNGNVGFPPAMAGVTDRDEVLKLEKVAEKSVVQNVLALDDLYVAEDTMTDSLMQGPFSRRESIASTIAIPLNARDRKVGVMFINYRNRHKFTDDELTNTRLFANQAAVAIRNAQLYEQEQRRATTLQALYEAGRAITGSLDLEEILSQIAEQAWRLTSYNNSQIRFAHIRLVKEWRAVLVAAYPLAEMSKPRSTSSKGLELNRGIIGRAIRNKAPQLAGDVTQDPDYVECHSDTHSELVVPIFLGEEVIGVINVEHPDRNTFDEEDQRNFELLAAQASIAIQNAWQYEELKQAKGLVEARTAIAYMGMSSSTWGHEVRGRANTIRDQVKHIGRDLGKEDLVGVKSRLREIDELAGMIISEPITGPPTSDEGVSSVFINALLRERIKQLWEHYPYRSVEPRLAFALGDSATVRANSEWLNQALDVLARNAVDAMRESDVKILNVSTRSEGAFALVEISDTGAGMPDDCWSKLLLEPINKPKESKRMGLGLLMARLIVQVYGGDILKGSTGPCGTTMIIRLPVEQ